MEIEKRERKRINKLIDQFLEEAAEFKGSLERAPSYRELDSLGGTNVITIILERIRKEDENTSLLLFPLLSKITKADPVPRKYRGIPGKTKASWVNWGIERRHIK